MGGKLAKCGVLCLTLIRCVGVKKVRLYGDNPSVHHSQSQIAPGELQGVAGGGGELCLGGETDTGISVCSLSSGSAHSSGCEVNGFSRGVHHWASIRDFKIQISR